MISFIVPGLPVAQPRQRHRVVHSGGRVFAQNYTPAKDPVQAFKAAIRLAAAAVYQGPPLEGPLSMSVLFVFPRPKSMLWKKRPMPREFKTSKPDWDNAGKAVADALTGQLWRDDAQIASVTVAKFVAAGDEQPHTSIVIDKLTIARGCVSRENPRAEVEVTTQKGGTNE